MPITDKVPVDASAKASVEAVLKDIRLRGRQGYKLTDYTFLEDDETVELDFEECAAPRKAKKKQG